MTEILNSLMNLFVLNNISKNETNYKKLSKELRQMRLEQEEAQRWAELDRIAGCDLKSVISLAREMAGLDRHVR